MCVFLITDLEWGNASITQLCVCLITNRGNSCAEYGPKVGVVGLFKMSNVVSARRGVRKCVLEGDGIPQAT